MEDLEQITAVGLRKAISEKRIGVEETVKAYLARIQAFDGDGGLNTVAELDPSVIAQARAMDQKGADRDRALFGLPLLVKDNIDVAGLHTTGGSLALADLLAERDADVVANLRRNGAVILGKTNMTEFANYMAQDMPNGYSSRGGQVKNAYDKRKDPGGSSTGSAVAMSASFCAAALGTDTSFSVVGCATDNGVTGLKPAHSSLSGKGILPISHTLDAPGTLTRDFTDALMIYSGMRDRPLPHIKPTPIRKLCIAVNTFNRDLVSEKQLGRYAALFDALSGEGACFTEVSHEYSPHMSSLMRCEFRHDLESYLTVSPAEIKTLPGLLDYYESHSERMLKYGDDVLRAALSGIDGAFGDLPYAALLSERERVREELLSSLRGFDACVMTGPTNRMHFAGLPSLALRLCMGEDGTPYGIILYSAEEERLFAAALTIESHCLPVTPPRL